MTAQFHPGPSPEQVSKVRGDTSLRANQSAEVARMQV